MAAGADEMAVLVVGATGRTGRRVVREASDRGHEVWATARSAPEADLDGSAPVHWRHGSATDPDAIGRLLDEAGSRAAGRTIGVVSSVGVGGSRGETHLYSVTAAVLAGAMLERGVRRLAVVSAAPVGDRSVHRLPQRALLPVLHAVFGATYRDMTRMEAALARRPELDWVSLRPPYLRDGPPRGRYRTHPDRPPRAATSMTTGDLATALLDAVTDPPPWHVAWVT